MNFKKVLNVLLILLIAVLGFFLIKSNNLPKYHTFFFSFIFFIAADYYIWLHIHKQIPKIRFISIPFKIIYWLSLFLVLVLLISTLLSDIKIWHPVLRTYLFGLIFVFYVPKLIIALFLFISDIFRFIKFTNAFIFNRAKFHQKFPNKRWKPIVISGYIIGIFTFIVLIWGMISEEFDFEVKDIDIEFSNLPASFDSLKIVQISDIHIGSWYGHKPLDNAIDKINELNPDIVFFTGDMVNFSSQEALIYKENLKKISAPLGVFAILGNHDYGDYSKWKDQKEKEANMQILFDFYKEIGWNLLRNEGIKLAKGKDTIQIIGVENWGKNPRFPQKGDIKLATSNLDSTKFSILLSHDPTHWQYIISKEYPKINLTLSGHTHAMQMGIEHDNFEWSPSGFIYKYWGGLYQNETNRNQYLYVNRGLGVVGYPGRIGIKPEITLIRLHKKL
jgi:hypothetical protein